jgi:hypothetical protein
MLRFTDAESLDRGALRSAFAGAGCVLAGAAVHLVLAGVDVGTWLQWTGPLFFAATATRGGWRERAKAMALGLSGIIGAKLLTGYPEFASMVTGGFVGAALTLTTARQRRLGGEKNAGGLQAASIVTAAVAWPLIVEGMKSIAMVAPQSSFVPPVILESAAGAAFGLLMGMTTAPLHLELTGDTIGAALQKLRPTLDGELRSLVMRIVDVRHRALKLLSQSRADTEVRRETRRGLDGVALMSIELTERFSAVDHVLTRMPLAGIEERTTEIQKQLETATDVAVRRDLEKALSALSDQSAQVGRLLQSRHRLVARLQSELAALEKTEMTLALLISGDAAVAGLRLESIGTSLGRQAMELEAEGSALQEALTLGPAAVLERVRQ